MKYCADRGIREALYRAFSTRASEFDGGKFDNTPLIKRILELRAEEASLLGFKNYGELSLATKMAKSPAEVLDFLRDVARRSKPRAEDDVAQVDAYARDELGIDKIEPWDRAYAAEKLREARYSYSDAEVKRYFTQRAVFKGLFGLVEKLFGIEIEEAQASVWHPDVKYFEVKRNGEKSPPSMLTSMPEKASAPAPGWTANVLVELKTASSLLRSLILSPTLRPRRQAVKPR